MSISFHYKSLSRSTYFVTNLIFYSKIRMQNQHNSKIFFYYCSFFPVVILIYVETEVDSVCLLFSSLLLLGFQIYFSAYHFLSCILLKGNFILFFFFYHFLNYFLLQKCNLYFSLPSKCFLSL